jgi:DNA-binding LacI/PurR family transcriptional regulator
MSNENKKHTTIVDIAKHLGISHTTVSRALNGSPKVKEVTRKKIIDAANNLGYVPNQNARGLSQGRTYTIGLFFTDLDNGTSSLFLTSIILNIRSQLPEDYVLSVNAISETTLATYFDGVVVVSQSEKDQTFINNLVKNKIPLVVLNRRIKNTNIVNYWLDNYTAAYSLTTHALNTGHKNLALIRGDLSYDSTYERSRGFFEAIKTWTKSQQKPLFVHPPVEGDYTAKGGYAAMNKLLTETKNLPDYVLIENDDMAFGALHAINENTDLKQNINVSGFDDVTLASYTTPSLTTVHSPILEMTELGVTALKKLISNNVADIPLRQSFSMPIVFRDSLH